MRFPNPDPMKSESLGARLGCVGFPKALQVILRKALD